MLNNGVSRANTLNCSIPTPKNLVFTSLKTEGNIPIPHTPPYNRLFKCVSTLRPNTGAGSAVTFIWASYMDFILHNHTLISIIITRQLLTTSKLKTHLTYLDSVGSRGCEGEGWAEAGTGTQWTSDITTLGFPVWSLGSHSHSYSHLCCFESEEEALKY